MSPQDLTCKEVTALVVAREDRDLPLPDSQALRAHMQVCDTCPVFERQIFTMRNAIRQWRAQQERDAEN
jgi:hypothetical protein